jgi:hypothetical protein
MELTSQLARSPTQPAAGTSLEKKDATPKALIKFGRSTVEMGGKEVGIFTLTMAGETMDLLPLRTWGQLDVHKWVPRGRLPGSPPGLEITPDHVKIAGQTVQTKDPDGCAKLDKVVEEWLALERETVELARRKSQLKADPQAQKPKASGPQPLHFRVEIDKVGQVHARCLQGEETLVAIGLSVAGFKSLITQGLMRKPHVLEVGALHDWVRLDDVIFSFEKGRNDGPQLEAALNQKYLIASALGTGKDVLVYANPASSTGFDIQFPVSVGGVQESRRRALNEESLELLQDRDRCGLLHPAIVIKLSRPTLIFKQKTPDGGERYLDHTPENVVITKDEDGNDESIDLSRPVNYMQLGPLELTAVFNHAAIHKHGKATARVTVPAADVPEAAVVTPPISALPIAEPSLSPPVPEPEAALPPLVIAIPVAAAESDPPEEEPFVRIAGNLPAAEVPAEPAAEIPGPQPNLWLADLLAEPPMEHKRFAFLVYNKIAEYFGNSHDGHLGQSACWDVTLDNVEDIEDPEFMGFFLTERGGFGFLNHGCLARFNDGVAFLGAREAGIEGIDIHLIAVGIDAEGRAVFVVTDQYRSKFGVAPAVVAGELENLEQYSTVLMIVQEVLENPVPLDIVWAVPRTQEDPENPRAVERLKPAQPQAEPVPLVDV